MCVIKYIWDIAYLVLCNLNHRDSIFFRNSSYSHYCFLLQVGDGGIIVLDATLDASTTDDLEWDAEWVRSAGPPSPCDVSFLNDNVLINGRSNLSRTPRNHKVSEPSL